MGARGYKAFESDWTCRGFQFEVGKTYTHEGQIEVCKSGFHFCTDLWDCFRYYRYVPQTKIAEVEALGDVVSCDEDTKKVTNVIKIVRELTWDEVMKIGNSGNWNAGIGNKGDWNSGPWNVGDHNSGKCNSGDWNSGHWNRGNQNSGDWNTGTYNSGNWNSGDRNSGDCNSGYWNSGDYNSGNRNSGCCNSGDWNSGDYNSGFGNSGNYNSGNWNRTDHSSGFFNTTPEPLYIFNRPCALSREEVMSMPGFEIIRRGLTQTLWVGANDMTDEEKNDHPNYNVEEGYLKTFLYKEAWRNLWQRLSDEEKQYVKELPNFDAAIFEEITGIKEDEQ